MSCYPLDQPPDTPPPPISGGPEGPRAVGLEQLPGRYRIIRAALEELALLFLPECRLVFVMYKPGEPECHLVVGAGKIEPFAEAAKRAAKSEAAA